MGNDQQEVTGLPNLSGSSQKPPRKRRLFFALWPSNDVRKSMDELNHQLPPPERGGRLLDSLNLHLTLHYIGPVDEADMDCLSRAAQQVESRPFKLKLDRLGYFKRPMILWLGCQEAPEGYVELLNQLAEMIATCGFEMEEGANKPHVSLRRKVSRPREYAGIQAIEWQIGQFVLMESVPVKDGVSYRVIESYPLNGKD